MQKFDNKLKYSSEDIHVVLGDTSGGVLCHCLGLLPEKIFAGYDDLSSGPLTSVDNPEKWQKVRREFWCGTGDPGVDELPDPSNLYIRLIAERDRVKASEKVFLWLGTTLAEQLLLAWLVAVFKTLAIGPEGFRLLELQPRKGAIMRSIGELNCELLEELTRWRQPGEGELASYETAWHAVSCPRPDDLIAFCRPDARHPQALKEALRAFMAHYPATGTGLNYWDRRLLENCRATRLKAARIVGNTMGQERQQLDWAGDFWLFCRLKRLGGPRLARPLVALYGTGKSMRATEVCLTEAGQRVLGGGANFVNLNGIDDWVGGVHISSREGTLWFLDGETLLPGSTA